MALQNVRAHLWRGEDLGYGSGNTREVSLTTKLGASARPLLVTQGFVSSQTITGYIGWALITSNNQRLRMVMNRSPDYWITLNAMIQPSLNATALAIQLPIAPLQSLFLPSNIFGPATLTMNSTWPIPVPPAGAPATTVPLASSSTTLTFDWLAEQ